jgi:hypothetical protein
MSDYMFGAGYDAGAVIDMNNIAIGYIPPSPAVAAICPAPMPDLGAPPQEGQAPQEALAPAVVAE